MASNVQPSVGEEGARIIACLWDIFPTLQCLSVMFFVFFWSCWFENSLMSIIFTRGRGDGIYGLGAERGQQRATVIYSYLDWKWIQKNDNARVRNESWTINNGFSWRMANAYGLSTLMLNDPGLIVCFLTSFKWDSPELTICQDRLLTAHKIVPASGLAMSGMPFKTYIPELPP